MTLPDFIIAGAIKSGTGALHQYLSHHPEIFVSPEKEPRFFTDDAASSGCQADMAAYACFFEGAAGEKAVGEASSNYLYSRDTAERIRAVLPEVRLIFSLRNPVDRAIAHYNMLKRSGKKAVSANPLDGSREGWATCSLYSDHVRDYLELFGPEQVKIMIFEEWVANTEAALRDVYRFLDVDDGFTIDPGIVYRAGAVNWPGLRKFRIVRAIKPYLPTRLLVSMNALKARLTPERNVVGAEARREMAAWYRDDIRLLEETLDRDLSVWQFDE